MVFLLLVALSAAPSQEQTAQIGKDIAVDFAQGADGLESRFDAEVFLDRTLAGMQASPEFLKGFRVGALKTLKPGSALAAAVAKGSTITFRKVTDLEDEPAVQLRILHPDGSFNVME